MERALSPINVARLPAPPLARGRIVLAAELHAVAREYLEARHDVVEAFTPSALLAAAEHADVIYARPPGNATERVLRAGSRLRAVATSGAGLDHIDVATASECGIGVIHVPGVGAAAVAEHAVTLALALAKRLPWADAMTRSGRFDVRAHSVPEELTGRTAAIIGLGHIGRETARRLGIGLGMHVLAYGGSGTPPDGVERVTTLDEALARADLVSLHLPLTAATRHIIGAAELRRMKPTSWLVNTARGGLVDEAALVDALRAGEIAGAGLDVFETEPARADNPLFSLDNVIVTPHLAGLTRATAERLAMCAAQRLCAVLAGKVPEGLANAATLGLHPEGGDR